LFLWGFWFWPVCGAIPSFFLVVVSEVGTKIALETGKQRISAENLTNREPTQKGL